MFFSHLTLRNFGSFESFELSFQPKGLTVLQGPNGAGKTQIKGALIAPLLGRAALSIDPSGVGPTDVRVSIQEYDNKEDLFLTVALHEKGHPIVDLGRGAPGAGLPIGPLARLLRRSISAQNVPQLLLRDEGDRTTAPIIDMSQVERLFPRDLHASPAWRRFRDNGGSFNFSGSGSSRALAVLLSEFAERQLRGHRLPLIVDEFLWLLSEEDRDFSVRLLEDIAERSQVILLTHSAWTGTDVELLDPTKGRARTLTSYNGVADAPPEYRPRATPKT